MPIDPNEAPESTLAVPVTNGAFVCPKCVYYKEDMCHEKRKCRPCNRKDNSNVYFIKKPQDKTMEDEWEYLTADSAENCKAIVDWMFSGCVQIFAPANGMWWDCDDLELQQKYRRKKPADDVLPPKKVKKLVDRTHEDFWPLIGRYWSRNKDGRRYIIACDHWNNAADSQANWQIAPLGSEEWGPMQKTVEVDA
jgi:hypothetical protein